MPLSPASLQALADDTAFCDALLARSRHLREQLDARMEQLLVDQLDGLAAAFKPSQVEVEVDEATRARLFEIVARQWAHVGEQMPHFSVLSHEDWRPEQLNAERLAAFYETGRGELVLLKRLLSQVGLGLPCRARCVELGCGVGRVTVHLAPQFGEVEGLDVSPGNLAECERALAVRGITNVRLTRLQTPPDIQQLAPYDLLFSRMVLQHNPPPIQHYLLRELLARLRPGGIAVFQLVTGGPGYGYLAAQHLQQHATTDFEIHALPMPAALALLRASGCALLDVFRDTAGGFNVSSYTFLAQKL